MRVSNTDVSDNRIAYILAQLNSGLRTQWSQIEEADSQLQRLLDDAHALANPHVSEAERAEWDQAWAGLRQTLDTIRALGKETRQLFAAEGSSDPLRPWSNLLDYEDDLQEAISHIGEIGNRSIPAHEKEGWDELLTSLELRSAALQAQALTVRFQLELHQKYGEQRANAFSKEIAARLPEEATLANVDEHVGEYCKAVKEYETERETFGGAWDVLKSLLLIPIKTPEERTREKAKRSLKG